jgi:hypothetical protein
MSRFRTYTAYSITCAAVWVAILALVLAIDPPATFRTFVLVGLGWWIAWVSGTIARFVYPPPERWRRS